MNTVIYNARLVDAKMDSKGMVVCENGKIKSIFLGEFDTEEKAEELPPVRTLADEQHDKP